MNQINKLIQQYCPNGVEMVKLISVADVLYGCPFDARLFTEEDCYIPLIRIRDILPGIPSTYYKGDYEEKYIIHKGDILVGMDGNFNLARWKSVDGVLCQRSCKIEANEKGLVLNEYLYHLLKPLFKEIEDNTPGGSVKHLSAKAINAIRIPLPPLPVQEEIVRILDAMSCLVDNLDEEIKARQKQYEHYREELLTFGEEVERVPMGELSKIGTGSSNRQDEKPNGIYPLYVRSAEVLKADTYEFDDSEAILIPGEGGIGDIFHYVRGKYALHQRVYRLFFDESCCVKFVYYHLHTHFKEYILGKAFSAAVTSIRKPMLQEFDIPLPPLSVQHEIVQKLDAFEDLIQNLTAERDLRQKQYEYYREKLLTF